MRVLSWVGLSFAAGIFLCHYVLPQTFVLPFVIACLCSGVLCGVLFRGKLRMRILLVCVCVVLGAVRYELHEQIHLKDTDALIGNSYMVEGVITDFSTEYEDGTRFTMRISSSEFPNCKVLVFAEENTLELRPGNRVAVNVKFSSATVISGEETDSYISKGVYLRGQTTDEIIDLGKDSSSVLYLPLYLGREIRTIIDSYVPLRAAVFMKALLTGDKSALYADTEIHTMFSQAGISHIVAVSGLHVSFVLGLVAIVFGRGRGWLFSILLSVIFAMMTGMSPSVMRAVFMQGLYLMAPVLRRESDGITSISFALLTLLLFNPFSIASVSLQLSFLAMLGIMLITPRILTWFNELGRKLPQRVMTTYHFVAASLSASIGAMLFTLPVCALYFGNITVLGFLTNLLVLWIVPICFGLGFVICLASLVSSKLALVLGTLLSACVEFIYCIAGMIAEIPWSNIYLPNTLFVLWFGIIVLSIGVMCLVKKKILWKPVVPILVSAVALIILVTCNNQRYRNGMIVAAIDVGQGQCIAVLHEDSTVVIDCGGDYDSGESAVRWLKSHGRDTIDCLVITHFDEDHVNGLFDLLSRMEVRKVYYRGKYISAEQAEMLLEIQRITEHNGGNLLPVTTRYIEEINGMSVAMYAASGTKDNDGLMVLLSSEGYELLVLGDSSFSAEKELIQSIGLVDGECIVVGHHGSKYSTGEDILKAFKPDTAIISCGFNTNGHPTDEVLDRLNKRNVVLYRTDQMGTIEVKVR